MERHKLSRDLENKVGRVMMMITWDSQCPDGRQRHPVQVFKTYECRYRSERSQDPHFQR